MPSKWSDYQEAVADFFRNLGLDAESNVTVRGSRTTHDVDVLVRLRHIGFDVMWIVECKLWETRITKVHVLALRTIVIDVGADRGILLSESGFQSGAEEAATLTNVHTTSLAHLTNSAASEVHAMQLRNLYDRVEAASELYWSISKEDRIALELRPDVGFCGYSGARVVERARDLLTKAFRGNYPITGDSVAHFGEVTAGPFATPRELIDGLNPVVTDLERRLARASRNV